MTAPTRHRLRAAAIIYYFRAAPILALLGVLAVPSHPRVQAAGHAGQPHTWHVSIGTDSKNFAITDMAYLPGDLSIDVGDTVIWTARSQTPHTVTFLQRGTKAPLFDPGVVMETNALSYDGVSYTTSGEMAARQRSGFADPATATYRLRFDKEGTFTYVDVFYHTITGRIKVRPAGTPYPYDAGAGRCRGSPAGRRGDAGGARPGCAGNARVDQAHRHAGHRGRPCQHDPLLPVTHCRTCRRHSQLYQPRPIDTHTVVLGGISAIRPSTRTTARQPFMEPNCRRASSARHRNLATNTTARPIGYASSRLGTTCSPVISMTTWA